MLQKTDLCHILLFLIEQLEHLLGLVNLKDIGISKATRYLVVEVPFLRIVQLLVEILKHVQILLFHQVVQYRLADLRPTAFDVDECKRFAVKCGWQIDLLVVLLHQTPSPLLGHLF